MWNQPSFLNLCNHWDTAIDLFFSPHTRQQPHVSKAISLCFCLTQRGNPILKFVRSVPWEFGEVVPDYVLGQTTCALFLRWVLTFFTFPSTILGRLPHDNCFVKKKICLLRHPPPGMAKSLRYHNLNPNYIHDRLKLLGQSFTLRILLVQVDVVSKKFIMAWNAFNRLLYTGVLASFFP